MAEMHAMHSFGRVRPKRSCMASDSVPERPCRPTSVTGARAPRPPIDPAAQAAEAGLLRGTVSKGVGLIEQEENRLLAERRGDGKRQSQEPPND